LSRVKKKDEDDFFCSILDPLSWCEEHYSSLKEKKNFLIYDFFTLKLIENLFKFCNTKLKRSGKKILISLGAPQKSLDIKQISSLMSVRRLELRSARGLFAQTPNRPQKN